MLVELPTIVTFSVVQSSQLSFILSSPSQVPSMVSRCGNNLRALRKARTITLDFSNTPKPRFRTKILFCPCVAPDLSLNFLSFLQPWGLFYCQVSIVQCSLFYQVESTRRIGNCQVPSLVIKLLAPFGKQFLSMQKASLRRILFRVVGVMGCGC